MKKILLTGGSGFVGKNVFPILTKKYNVKAPSRQELDLRDSDAVKNYVKKESFDVVIHSANPNPVKSSQYDSNAQMFEDSMRIFMNFYNVQDMCGKILYLGSGAEYDKSKDIKNIKEEDANRSLPKDIYGCSKFIMNELTRKSDNIFNLRLFACYGPYDHESKFITHVIRCCLAGRDITMRRNCYFDYLHVYDLAKIMVYFIEHDMKYHDYNIASGERISLRSIADEVKRQMKHKGAILIEESGWNKEYTANIDRLEQESHLKQQFLSLEQGIALQIKHEKEKYR